MSIVRPAIVVIAMCSVGLSAGAQSTPPDAAVRAGFTALERGDADTAATAFRGALSQRPRDPVLLYGAGVAAHLQGRERDALHLLQQALESEPRLTQASALLGGIAYGEGDLELAIKTYESALVNAPANVSMRQQLVAWRRESGRP